MIECSGDLPKVKPYDEWLVENHPNWEDEDPEDLECEECNGTGEMDCPECDGTPAHRQKDGINPKEKYRKEYEEQVAADLERLKKWGG